jgi:small multidrug resistance pump
VLVYTCKHDTTHSRIFSRASYSSLTLKKLEIGVIYAIWSGLGTALIVLVGVLWFKEPLTILKTASILLIIAGVVGLNLGGAH